LKKTENYIFSNFKNQTIKFFWKTGKNKNIPTITNKHPLTKNKQKTKPNMKKQKISFFQKKHQKRKTTVQKEKYKYTQIEKTIDKHE